MPKDLLDLLALVAGALLSVIVEIPFVKKGYDQLTDGQKRLVMAGLLVVAAALIYGVSCTGFLDVFVPGIALTCDSAGLAILIRALLLAIAANQGVFGLAFRGRGKNQPIRVQ